MPRHEDMWVRVFGMLRQTWCRVEQHKKCVELSFFDDDKAIFDSIKYPTIDIAHAALIKNQFCPSWDVSDAIVRQIRQNEPFSDHPLRKWMNEYSSGENWVEPCADDPHEYVRKIPVLKQKKQICEPKRSSVICIHVAPADSNSEGEALSAVTRERIESIEAKALARLKASKLPDWH